MADTGQSLRQGRWETSGMEIFPMCAQQGQRDASQASRGWLEWQPRVGGGRPTLLLDFSTSVNFLPFRGYSLC